MMIQKRPKHYKSKNEDSISKIRVDIVLLLIFFCGSYNFLYQKKKQYNRRIA